MILLYYIIFYCVSFCEQNPKSSLDLFFSFGFCCCCLYGTLPSLMFTLVNKKKKKLFIFFPFRFGSVRECDVCAHTITIKKKRSKTKWRSPLAQKFNKAQPKIKHKSLQIQNGTNNGNNFNRTFTECCPAT